MAAVAAPAVDQAADLMKNLKLDSQTKVNDAAEPTKKPSLGQHGSANGGEAPNASVPPREPTFTPLLQEMNQMMDPANMCYMPNGYPSNAYYYAGYGGSVSEWEDYQRYFSSEGGEAVYGDMYGYAPYNPYASPDSPVPTMVNDSQLYGTQHYQYPPQYYQPPTPSASYTPNQDPMSQGGVSTSVAADQTPLSADSVKVTANGTAKGNANESNGLAPLKPSQQNQSLASNNAYVKGGMPGGLASYGYQDFGYGYDAVRSPASYYGSLFSTGQHRPATTSAFPCNSSNSSVKSQNQRPLPHLMGLHSQRPTSGFGSASPGFTNKMYANNRMYGQFGNTYRTGSGFGQNGYDSRINGRWSLVTDNKYKPRGRGNGSYGYGNENLDGFSELNRGPRAGCFKNLKVVGPNVTIAVKGQNLSSIAKEDLSAVLPDREQYNREDFPEEYSDAKFFIIKSYSEDDVHKSIKYGVWASTPNGNKKLDGAYREAQEKAGECPVFLLFSVNTSGQFVGLAEMVGPVDFEKTVGYWQQDKWFGCFPVKWHLVKDVPNSILKHITLENNDNKPVTNSRDTQEVKLDQGLQMLKLFKEHVSKTSILDDFGFYESRQKMMQEKRAKQQLFQKQAWDGKASEAVVDEKVGAISVKPALQKPLESIPVLNNEADQSDSGVRKPSEENGECGVAVDASKVDKPVTEKPTAVNGVPVVC